MALVIQLNSRGATVSDERIVELATQMRRSTVPIAVWVGPSGAQARGAAAQLVGIASPGGVWPRRRGSAGPARRSCRRPVRHALGRPGRPPGGGHRRGGDDDAEALKELGLVNAPVLVDFVGQLEGVAVRDGGAATSAPGPARQISGCRT